MNGTENPQHITHILGCWRFKIVLITVLLSILGYFLFTLWAGWENVMSALNHVGFVGIILAISLSCFNLSLRFIRWQLFLKNLGHSPPLITSLRIYLAGFSLTTTPGKTGEALRGIFLKDYGIPFRKSFGAFLAERLSDLLAVTILASGGLWVYPGMRSIIFIVIPIIIFILYAAQKASWLKYLESCAKKMLPQRFATTVEFFLETILSFRACFRIKTLLPAIILGIAAWTAEGIALYYILHLIGYDLTPLVAIFIYGFSLVIGGITMLPGGLGGAEVTMVKLLTLQAIAAPAAVAVTLVIRLTSLWFSVCMGFICLATLSFRKIK